MPSYRFYDMTTDGAELEVRSGKKGIMLMIYEAGHISMFCLDPDQFGDVAAALWECSPTKPPVTITESKQGSPSVDEAQLGIFEDQTENSRSHSYTQGAEAEDREEAANSGDGAGQAIDTGTDSGSAERS